MELTYKKVVDGVKVSLEELKTVIGMTDMVYKTLSQTGQITTEQVVVHENLLKIVMEIEK